MRIPPREALQERNGRQLPVFKFCLGGIKILISRDEDFPEDILNFLRRGFGSISQFDKSELKNVILNQLALRQLNRIQAKMLRNHRPFGTMLRDIVFQTSSSWSYYIATCFTKLLSVIVAIVKPPKESVQFSSGGLGKGHFALRKVKLPKELTPIQCSKGVIKSPKSCPQFNIKGRWRSHLPSLIPCGEISNARSCSLTIRKAK
eukprot:TRINITY_DN20241_c0_g5_i1.p1 TRINITY_DN20241_c0_g5~~TRINITY_DN20241_c0_g5_i1.p1  ORF type:complete len:204 (-),score=7.79 TRINITY_DN20241_c0_g5_i1:449-1060(-)